MKYTFHESLYRGHETMERLASYPITVCGAGALGANLTETLARCGAKNLTVIDRDRIEEVNLSTQPYELDEVGVMKAVSLSRMLYRAVGSEVAAEAKELNAQSVRKLLKTAELVVDCFDNSTSRGLVTDYCKERNLDCMHVGMANGFAEVIWNEHYRVPSERQDDICDYPLARNLVTLAVAVACETILKFLASETRHNWSITLDDLAISCLAMR
ncbi:MAG: ThiF family adenylyltransferase [Candidatus Eremiobacteraeota bacterium]|nr:ThiF family adenylyltransferase [Candidatus Eremiobacteraeota bacterium]